MADDRLRETEVRFVVKVSNFGVLQNNDTLLMETARNLGNIPAHLKVGKQVEDKAREGGVYAILGEAHFRLGQFVTVIDCFERHLKIAKEVRDRVAEGASYSRIGISHFHLGHFRKAIDNFERLQNLAKEIGDRSMEGKAYSNLGCAHFSLGDFKTAMDYHERHLKIAKELGDRLGEGVAYGHLGCAHRGVGDYNTAIGCHEYQLKVAKEIGNRTGEGSANTNLGSAHFSLGNFKTAINYHESCIKIAREVGDRALEGKSFGNLGCACYRLGEFKTAIDYYEQALQIATDLEDVVAQGKAYGNLGNAHDSLGDHKTAIEYHERQLKIAKKVGDRSGEGIAYGNLGCIHSRLRDFKEAINCHKRQLKIAKELGDRSEEAKAYGNLGDDQVSLGDFELAIENYELQLKIAKELGDRWLEGNVCEQLGQYHYRLGDFNTAKGYHERRLEISKEVEDKVGVACSLYGLGRCFNSLGCASEALNHYHCSVTAFNDIRGRLQFNDEWKISLRHTYNVAYASLWRLLLTEGKVLKALFSADQGRAQALKDLIEFKYGFQTTPSGSGAVNGTENEILKCLPANTVFIANESREVIFWICQKGKEVQFRRKEISNDSSLVDVSTFFQSLIQMACEEIGARAHVKCEDRSLDETTNENLSNSRSPLVDRQTSSSNFTKCALSTFFDTIISPIQDLLLDSELVLVPEGPLYLAPFGAFKDSNSKYLCESFKIRLVPSLSSLKLIADCPLDYHSKTGALLVGDPWIQEVSKLLQLPCAREEVQMIGRILHTTPLIGRQATKDEVLKRLPSVALVHIAAHGRMETGEIALAPNPTPASQTPVEGDFMLTMKDVLSVQMRAQLVVLSCCHSARGDIKAEGVVGIARAFLGAGARSVLVSLWAIDDEATLEFMNSFYQHLVKGKSASESLNQAMKCMKESDQFSAVKYWAPFVLIGDDVTLEFEGFE